jgi:hypothetical protein
LEVALDGGAKVRQDLVENAGDVIRWARLDGHEGAKLVLELIAKATIHKYQCRASVRELLAITRVSFSAFSFSPSNLNCKFTFFSRQIHSNFSTRVDTRRTVGAWSASWPKTF